MRNLLLVFGFCMALGTAWAQTVVGRLAGDAGAGAREAADGDQGDEGADGKLAGNFYSIDQMTDPFPLDSITQDGTTVKFALNAVHASYVGTLSDDGNSIIGTFTQGGDLPLNFVRVTKETAWVIDPSKHTVQFVTVEPGVKLEVLDWGGTGRPLVLLTGLGNNAHVFDGFAEKLTGKYHVYGITRRGYGLSDTPAPVGDAYAADRLGDDVAVVLDALKLQKPVLVGHSIAGEELSSIGSRFPNRVAGLVYLDAGYSYALYDEVRGDLLIDGLTLRKTIDELSTTPTPSGQRALIAEMLKVDLPHYEKDLAEQNEELTDMSDGPSQPMPDKKDRRRVSAEAIRAGAQKYTGDQMSGSRDLRGPA